MTIRFAPHAHKVPVREIATGLVTQQWPVDARDLVAFPEYEYVTDAAPVDQALADTPPTHAATPAPPAHRDTLDAMSHTELRSLAKRAGVDHKLSKAGLIDALMPHIVGGTVALEAVPHFTLPHPQFPTASEG